MIKQMYKQYFQKSYTFLYPLLGFKRTRDPRPVQVYVHWPEEFPDNERKLVCIYQKEDTEQWLNFEKNKLMTHTLLDYVVPLCDGKVAYIFDMNPSANDYDIFIQGKYSKFSQNAKRHLSDYYGIHTPEWAYVESFIFPKKYFKDYAEMLSIDVATLQQVGELCDKYNKEKETYKL